MRTRTRGDSFSARDRAMLYLLDAARWPDRVARCALCERPVVMRGPRSGPGSEAVMVAGHVIAREDGGLPVLGNGRVECTPCSRAEGGRRREARRTGRAMGAEQPTSSLGRWLVSIDVRATPRRRT